MARSIGPPGKDSIYKYFGVEIKQVLEVLGKCLLKSGSAMSFMLQDRISVVYS